MSCKEFEVTHKKSGATYIVIGEAYECTNARAGNVVVLYTDVKRTRIYCRDADEFMEKFD